MKWIAKFTVGAAAIAAAFALPQGASAQTRSELLTHGVGTARAQRLDAAPSPQSVVYVAPETGVNEEAVTVGAYETSPWRPRTAEAVSEADYEAELERANEVLRDSQERAALARLNRHTTRPLDVPATLGVLKNKPANSQARQRVVQSAIKPQYLQYSPSAPGQAPQTTRSAYPPQTYDVSNAPGSATSGAGPSLNWDGSTSRGKQFGRTQAPSAPTESQLVVINASTAAQEPAVENAVVAQDAQESSLPAVLDTIQQDSEQENGVANFDDAFSNSVLQEIQDASGSLSGAPVEDAAINPNAAAPEAPVWNETAPIPSEEASDEIDVPDFNSPENLAPVPETESDAIVPETPSYAPVEEPAPAEAPATDVQTSPVVPAPTPADPEPAPVETPATDAQTPSGVPAPASAYPGLAPAADPAYPNGCVLPQYAPQANYLSVAPYTGRPAYVQSTPRLPQSYGVPSQFNMPRQSGIPQYQGAPQYQCAPQYQDACAQNGFACDATTQCGDSGMTLMGMAPSSARPGLILGAEWLYWSTDPGVSYAAVKNEKGRIAWRDFKGKNTGLRGRFGFRSLAGWDLIGTFTWFDEGEDGRFTSADLPSNHTFTNARFGRNMELNSIESRMKTELQTIDIEMGRWADCGQWSFRVFGGVRWTGLTEKVFDQGGITATAGGAGDLLSGEIAVLDSSAALVDEEALETDALLGATAAATAFEDGTVTQTATNRIGTTSRLNAYGVRLGIETRLGLSDCFGVYGKGAGALAAGRVKSTLFVDDHTLENEFKKTYLTPSVDAGLGLYWRVNGLEARGGYEFNGWYNSGYVSGRKTDFLAHGVVAGLGYNY